MNPSASPLTSSGPVALVMSVAVGAGTGRWMGGRIASISARCASYWRGSIRRSPSRVTDPPGFGGELEQHSARLAKIDRVEVVPIDHRRGLEPRQRDPLAHPELRGVVGDAPRHVVDRSRSPGAAHETADRAHVHDGSGPAIADGEPPGGAVFADGTEAKRVHEHALGVVAVLRPDRHAMKAVDRVLARDAGCLSPGGPRFGPGVADELQHQPIVVLEGNHLPRRPLKRYSVTHEPLDPESQCARQHGERRDGDLACPLAPGSRAGPGEEGHDAPRSADLIAEVEMVGLRIVEIHGALHQPEAEQPHVEVEVLLLVTRDRGDVMDAEDACHDQYSANASSG